MNNRPRYRQGPELLVELLEQASHTLSSQGGISSSQAEMLAIAIADRMAVICGGDFFYFPKGTWNGGLNCFQLAERDWEIYREYRSTNRHDLITRYGISMQRLYQILAACRRHLATSRRQDSTTPPPRAAR